MIDDLLSDVPLGLVFGQPLRYTEGQPLSPTSCARLTNRLGRIRAVCRDAARSRCLGGMRTMGDAMRFVQRVFCNADSLLPADILKLSMEKQQPPKRSAPKQRDSAPPAAATPAVPATDASAAKGRVQARALCTRHA